GTDRGERAHVRSTRVEGCSEGSAACVRRGLGGGSRVASIRIGVTPGGQRCGCNASATMVLLGKVHVRWRGRRRTGPGERAREELVDGVCRGAGRRARWMWLELELQGGVRQA